MAANSGFGLEDAAKAVPSQVCGGRPDMNLSVALRFNRGYQGVRLFRERELRMVSYTVHIRSFTMPGRGQGWGLARTSASKSPLHYSLPGLAKIAAY